MRIPRFSTAPIVALALAGAMVPFVASAHNIQGSVQVDCTHQTVKVHVTNWDGNVEIKKLSNAHLTERMPSSPNSVVTFSTSEIGGNGDYTVGRQNHPNDPTPVRFNVSCTEPTPAPTPTPTSTPTPSPTPISTPRPTPTPTGTSTESPVSTPTPTTEVEGTVTPSLPHAGHPPVGA